jgi:integrase
MKGHIRRRGERSWELKFDLDRDPVTGKRETRYHSFKGTKREAQAELVRLSAAALTGAYVDPTTVTVGEFLNNWENNWAANQVSPKTHERFSQLIAHQVRPHVGNLPIQKIRATHLNELYGKLLRDGRVGGGQLSAKTVGHVHRCLRRAFGHASEWGIIAQNPAALVRPPRVQQVEIEILRENEVEAMLASLRDRNALLCTIAILALGSGLRRGELCALRWSNIDLDSRTLRVEQSIEQTRAGLRSKAPKTKHGLRAITLPASVVSELRAHWRAQNEQRLALGLGRSTPDDLVFPAWGNQLLMPNTLSREWSRAIAAIGGRRISLHALRHTHASSLIAAGVDILTVSRRLGHANPTITLGVYGHLYGNTDDKAAQAVEAMFARIGGAE